jgi:hypothetical protein
MDVSLGREVWMRIFGMLHTVEQYPLRLLLLLASKNPYEIP